jgi:hypothetical protein
MGATPGNQWWKLRAKHGRDKTFSSPEHLWESCMEYFEATDKRKWVKKDWVGKDATQVDREVDTPYTLSGLCLFLDIDVRTWNNYKNQDSHKEFIPVISHVEQIMYTQKFEGATVNTFNANIIARDLGLAEKTENHTAVNFDLSALSEEDKKQLFEISLKLK